MPWTEDIGHGWERHYHVTFGDTVVHAGAYHGKFGWRMSERVGETGQVILIEPHKQAIRVMEAMIEELDLKNVTLVKCAVHSEKGRMGMVIPPDCVNPYLSNTSEEYCRTRGYGFDMVQVNTVDSILDYLDIARVGLFVADVENSEIAMVRGMDRHLSDKTIFNLAIAAYHRHPMGNYADINHTMSQHGYILHPHTECCYAYVGDDDR
jgi:FkbM family methyltransferase